MRQRDESWQAIQDNPGFDVLVVGGGVNGIATYRDLALQGLRVLLVEQADYCSGSSAASSHMLHGGIRYLENGEFRLVREALHERNLMLKNAPHYSQPLQTTVPMFRWFSGLFNAPLRFLGLRDKPAERGAIVIKLGLMMYDWFTRDNRAMPTHRFHLRRESLRRYPHIDPNIRCTATYYDAWMVSPERICIDMLDDADRASTEAIALNYAAVVDALGSRVTIENRATGERTVVQPRVVVNAAGPWIDQANRAMSEPTQFIGGTKGSHIMVDNDELYQATNGSEIFFENADGRIVLIFPFVNRVMIGTTDIRVDDPDNIICTPEEVGYMLNFVRRIFPDIVVRPEQIVYRFSGVRPLPHSDSSRTGTISRDHSIRTLTTQQSGLTFPIHSLVGGKWTTMRAFAEQTTDLVLGDLKQTRQVSTRDRAFGGGVDYPFTSEARQEFLEALRRDTEMELAELDLLFGRYGTRAAEVARHMADGPDATLQSVPGYTRREVGYIAAAEQVEHLDDYFKRRSLLAMLGTVNQHDAVIEEVAEVLAQVLDWDEMREQAEIERTRELFVAQHGLNETEPQPVLS